MLTFMFGDLKIKKIAFLLDVGGGWLAAAKVGLYYNGFVFKLGYELTGNPNNIMSALGHNFYYALAHNISLNLGYKFNWAETEID